MTATQLGVSVEVWPVAADRHGIWLVAAEQDAWRSGPIAADSEPHRAVVDLLRRHPGHPHAAGGAWDSVRFIHSTSWRTDVDTVVLTYIAVLGGHGSHEFVRDVWPGAEPVGLDLTDAVGRPDTVGPTDPPAPRYVDVLLHGIRHLRFLLNTDVAAQAALDDHWRFWLADLQPALAGMYQS